MAVAHLVATLLPRTLGHSVSALTFHRAGKTGRRTWMLTVGREVIRRSGTRPQRAKLAPTENNSAIAITRRQITLTYSRFSVRPVPRLDLLYMTTIAPEPAIAATAATVCAAKDIQRNQGWKSMWMPPPGIAFSVPNKFAPWCAATARIALLAAMQ